MKHLILIALTAGVAVSAAPIYDPKMESVRTPTDTEYCAFEYALKNQDDLAFVVNYLPMNTAVKPDDEITGAHGNRQEIQEDNKSALAYARRVIAGEVEIPVAIEFKVLRYNPENQMFITSCLAPELVLNIDYSTIKESLNRTPELYGRASGSDVILQNANMHTLVFDHWDDFSGLRASPDIASAILKTATNRTLEIVANCRLIPNSTFKVKNGQARMKAEIVGYRIETKQVGLGKQAPLLSEVKAEIQLVPYVRTASENSIAEKTGGKLLISSKGGILLEPAGTFLVLNANLDLYANLQSKIRAVAGGMTLGGHWFEAGSKLVMVTDREMQVYDYAVTDAGLTISGIAYHREEHIKFEGGRVIGVP